MNESRALFTILSGKKIKLNFIILFTVYSTPFAFILSIHMMIIEVNKCDSPRFATWLQCIMSTSVNSNLFDFMTIIDLENVLALIYINAMDKSNKAKENEKGKKARKTHRFVTGNQRKCCNNSFW